MPQSMGIQLNSTHIQLTPSYQAHPLASVPPHAKFFYLREQVLFISTEENCMEPLLTCYCNIFLSFWIKDVGGQEPCSDFMCGWKLSWALEVIDGVHFLASLWLSLAFEGELFLSRVRFKSLFAWRSYCLFVSNILEVHFYFV